MELIKTIDNKVEVFDAGYTISGQECLHACFKVGATYQVPSTNLISKGAEVNFTVLKNTHKSVTIEVVEKYNGTITTNKLNKFLNKGGHGFWVTVQGVKYSCVEMFTSDKLSRWVKGYLNPFTCELATKELTEDVQTVSPAEHVETVAKVLDFTPVYYPIDEHIARLGHEMNSFREYQENSTTEYYKSKVNEVFAIAEKNQSEKSLYLANIYAKKFADYLNTSNRVETLCPSIMISGAGNFNVRKKEKQNARRDNLMKEYAKLQNLIEKIERPEGYGYAEIKRDTIVTNEFESVPFFKVVSNEEVNRIQLVDFEEIPTDEQKTILKKNGFRWSPRFKAWQRQLTENAISGVWCVVKEFERLENEEIEELHATIQENKPVEKTIEPTTVEPVEETPKAEPVAPVETLEPCKCFKCPLGKKCKHYNAFRRYPRSEGGLGLCHILNGTIQDKIKEMGKPTPVEEIKLECVKSIVIDFKHPEEIPTVETVEEVEPVQVKETVETVEEVEPVQVKETFEPCNCFDCPLGNKCKYYQKGSRFPAERGGFGTCYILKGTLQDEIKEMNECEVFDFAEMPKLEKVKINGFEVGKHYEILEPDFNQWETGLCIEVNNLYVKLRIYTDISVVSKKFYFTNCDGIAYSQNGKQFIESTPATDRELKVINLREEVQKTCCKVDEIHKYECKIIRLWKFVNPLTLKQEERLKNIGFCDNCGVWEKTVFSYVQSIHTLENVKEIFKEFEVTSVPPEPVPKAEPVPTEIEICNISADKMLEIFDTIEECSHVMENEKLINYVSKEYGLSIQATQELYNDFIDDTFLGVENEPVEVIPLEPVKLENNSSCYFLNDAELLNTDVTGYNKTYGIDWDLLKEGDIIAFDFDYTIGLTGFKVCANRDGTKKYLKNKRGERLDLENDYGYLQINDTDMYYFSIL